MTKSVCVLLGANSGSNSSYLKSAEDLGMVMAKMKIRLIYGGGRFGLMGMLADSILKYGGEVMGVITKSLYETEVHSGLTEILIVENMQERKKMMADLSEGCIALPGGLGTLEEIFEFWNASKLGIYNYPLALLNIDNYFDPLIKFIRKTIEQGFLKSENLTKIIIKDEPEEILKFMLEEANISEVKHK